MIKTTDLLGMVPSLEVLPFFARNEKCGSGDGGLAFQPNLYSSYGEIGRQLLTKRLKGGIIPWEIFVSDILSLPGQRNHWHVPIFLNACPTELVLREPVYRAFHPPKGAGCSKVPAHLTLGVESQSSLTKFQFREWLARWPSTASTKLSFKMLPMDLMVQALEAEVIDAIIAPSPWGLQIESQGIGKMDLSFSPGKFSQRLAVVCHKDFLDSHGGFIKKFPEWIAAARGHLKDPAKFGYAAGRMAQNGKSVISEELMRRAGRLHAFSTLTHDIVPDAHTLATELARLAEFSVLPAQVGQGEQTARLLLCS